MAACSLRRTIGILGTDQILDEERWRESYQSLRQRRKANGEETKTGREGIIRPGLFGRCMELSVRRSALT